MYKNKDVFQNETEFNADSDYRKFAPEIMAGEPLPEYPTFAERHKLKTSYSTASIVMFLFFVGVELFSYFTVVAITQIIQAVYVSKGWSFTVSEYERIFSNMTFQISLNAVLFFTVNIVTFLVGCKIFNFNIPKFFEKKSFKNIPVVTYIFAAFALQYITGYAADIVDRIFESNGVRNYSPQFSTTTLPAMVMTVVYSCIIAPVTEELLYRGFALKAFSIVSQRTGIYVSAIFFAIGHQNIAQALLAFAMGLLLGYIMVKHNSILLCIIIHAAVNTAATLFSEMLPQLLDANVLNFISTIFFFAVLFFGLASLIILVTKNDFPQKNRLQRTRSRLFLGTIAFWAVVAVNFYETITAIINVNLSK